MSHAVDVGGFVCFSELIRTILGLSKEIRCLDGFFLEQKLATAGSLPHLGKYYYKFNAALNEGSILAMYMRTCVHVYIHVGNA